MQRSQNRIAKVNLKKNQVGELTLIDLKTYCKDTVSRGCVISGKVDKQNSSTEQSPEIDPYIYMDK